MGYWRQDEHGHSMVVEETGMIWGDEPADIMDKALDEIIEVFKAACKRLPTEAEIKAGLLFSLQAALDRAQETDAAAEPSQEGMD